MVQPGDSRYVKRLGKDKRIYEEIRFELEKGSASKLKKKKKKEKKKVQGSQEGLQQKQGWTMMIKVGMTYELPKEHHHVIYSAPKLEETQIVF